MDLSVDVIAKSCKVPSESVEANWPLILGALREQGIASMLTQVATAATVAVETARTFQPIHEYGGPAYFTKHYEGRADLGNSLAGDGVRYHGRGFVQLTGRVNYHKVGAALGLPLEENPDLALDPAHAARILAWFVRNHGVARAAEIRDWRRTRLLINGGYNGWDDYIACVTSMLGGVHA
ncbi:MAG TPA: glycoside hydrolase family 19 protein [Holophaga sp.]|nr:glycoside hydrolase family 19 protein [Holophaga sp.]